jgi:hypothetical protein
LATPLSIAALATAGATHIIYHGLIGFYNSDCFERDFNNAPIYFALITKLDIFNGSFEYSINKALYHFFHE